jgi:HD-GYP domain-containing protein (c-di-GMP phosphodiesterase class II)
MSTPGSAKTAAAKTDTAPAQQVRALPFIVYFEHDLPALETLKGVRTFRRCGYSTMHEHPADVERVLVTSSERLLTEHNEKVRSANWRIIALSDQRFRDARIDGLVYAYVPLATPASLLERLVENALDHIHLIASRQEVNDRLAFATREINELNRIGAALSAEHDTDKLLEMILTKSREFTNCDAGSLYIVEDVEPEEGKEASAAERKKRLRFKLAQNDTVNIRFRETTIEISQKSVAGFVALTGQTVMIDDAYHLPPGVPYSINRRFDRESGYRTMSILAVPMRNQQREVVGVVQLINPKRHVDVALDSTALVQKEVVAFTSRQRELMESLASQAAVAYENSRLYSAIQRLFEGFVRASVTAIETRDPTTSGHSFRVANLTVALAEAVDRAQTGPYSDVRFTREQMREIRYASLLHDFGKVGVREEVLVKAKKLYPLQLELIRQRFDFVKRSMEVESLRAQLKHALDKSRAEYSKHKRKLDAALAKQWKEMDEWFRLILETNEPTVLPEGNFDRLFELSARSFKDLEGDSQPLLTDQEVRLLSIRQGSLDDAERLQIESHVVHTFNFLQQIPWTKEIGSIPDIARGHHEKLNGKGYPYKLTAPEIPVQTRMMTIADIFDALSAGDRPYKKAVSPQRALDILKLSVEDGELDSHLFELFLEAKVYERWKVESYPY